MERCLCAGIYFEFINQRKIILLTQLSVSGQRDRNCVEVIIKTAIAKRGCKKSPDRKKVKKMIKK